MYDPFKNLISARYYSRSVWIFFFKGNIFLRTLDLSYNGLGKEGAVALEEALKNNNTLEDLNIRYCRHSMVIYHNCAHRRVNVLKAQTALTYCSLRAHVDSCLDLWL